MSAREYLDSIIAAHTGLMPQGPLQPRQGRLSMRDEASLDADYAAEREAVYKAELAQALTGSGEFWDGNNLTDALRFACSMPCASPAERWAVVERAILEQADIYAAWVADGK